MIAVAALASIAILFFVQILDRLSEEELFRKSFFAFEIITASIIVHLFYHISGDILVNDALEDFFEILAFILFSLGIIIVTRTALMTQISIEAHRKLQEEVNTKTESLKLYAVELRNSNNLKDLFTDIISHDLLNPVGIIKNFSELMLREKKEIKDENIKAVKRNSEKAIEIIESAALFSRVQELKKEDFEDLDLGNIIAEETNNLIPNASLKKIKIDLVLEDEYPVKGARFLGNVFSNLISNAIKYSPPESSIILRIDKRDGAFRFSVKDQGEGIEDTYKESIFTRFERLSREGVKGSGLGLAIVKRIVELHEGKVWVEDNPEGGSIFIVEIPRAP